MEWQEGKSVCSSVPFLQTQMVNKRKFFPSVFFDFHASVSTFLWWELFGLCCSWHLSPGCLCLELLAGRLCSPHASFCSPQLASKCPAILKSLPGSHLWVIWSWGPGPGQLLPHTSPAGTWQKRQDYPDTLSFLID